MTREELDHQGYYMRERMEEIKREIKDEYFEVLDFDDPIDHYAGYDSSRDRIERWIEEKAKEYGVSSDLMAEACNELEREAYEDWMKETEWAETPGNLTPKEYDAWYRGDLDIRDRIKSSRRIQSDDLLTWGELATWLSDEGNGSEWCFKDEFDEEGFPLRTFTSTSADRSDSSSTEGILVRKHYDDEWSEPTREYCFSSRRIQSAKYSADELFDACRWDMFENTIFLDRDELKSSDRQGGESWKTQLIDLLTFDVAPHYLGVNTIEKLKDVCRKAKNPKAKKYLEMIETAEENARFVDKYFGSIKLHKKANFSKKIQSDRYTLGDCSLCGTRGTKRVEDFLLEHGFDNVDFACDILDIDPEEEICEECFNGMLPELNSKYYSEYDDLGTDVRTGEPFVNSSKVIKSANLFAPTTPCDVMLDDGKVAPAGCEFEVSYDRNEQGEYVLGIEVKGLGKGSIRFDSEAEAKKDGWIVSKRVIKSDAESEQKLKEDLIRQGYTEEEATQIVTQRKPEEDQQTAGEESQWGI